MYHKILFATDLMHNSQNFAHQAKRIAEHFSGELSVLHIIEPPSSAVYAASLGFAKYPEPVKDDAQLVLSTLCDEIDIPKSHQRVEVGSVKQCIISVADEIGADLIIIGCHGQAGWSHLLGSTANAVLHHAHCDVITLRPQQSS